MRRRSGVAPARRTSPGAHVSDSNNYRLIGIGSEPTMRGAAMEEPTPTDLAVVLHDLAWVLPRTIGRERDPRHLLPASELEIMRLLVRRPGLSVNEGAAGLRLGGGDGCAAL